MTWFAPGGGVDQELLILLREQSKNYNVSLLVGRDKFHTDFEQIPGIEIITCKWLVSKFNIFLDVIALVWIWKFLSLRNFDLIHTHETKSSLIVRLANLRKKPLIYGLHGVVFNDRRARLVNLFYKKIEKLSINFADRIVAVGSDVKSTYLSNKIGSKKKWHIVPSGIEVDKFCAPQDEKKLMRFRNELGIPHNSFVWINIGRFSISKNQIDCLVAFMKFSAEVKSQTDLVLFGVGPEVESLKRFEQMNPQIKGHIHFAGLVKDIHDYAKLGQAQIFTSIREGVPRAVIECGLMSIPTISYVVDGIHEVITDDYSGYIVNSGDIESLVLRMKDYFYNPLKLREHGQKAKEVSLAGWDSRIMVQQIDELYGEMLSSSKRRNWS